jgi:flagellar biogenesis protein FliO
MPAGNVSLFLGVAMLAAFALVAGGVYLIRRRVADRRRGVLMLVAALVLLGNVLILTWPI